MSARAAHAFRAAHTVLRQVGVSHLLRDELDRYNDPDQPVTVAEVLALLESVEGMERMRP